MITLITGASASGKSGYAEKYAASAGGALIYVATMHNDGTEEMRLRIEKHKKQRFSYGFDTIERETDIGGISTGRGYTLLVECISNLLANEMFMEGLEAEMAVEKIMSGLVRLSGQADNIIIVTNEVFSDGCRYDRDTLNYIEALALLNCSVAELADNVIEVVYTIPVIIKGKGLVSDENI